MNESSMSGLPDNFMPHGMCFLWRPDILALHVLSDALIALSYFSIPFALIYFARKRQDLQFTRILLSFAAFIVACGASHAMEIWTIWHPDYWASGAVKATTALVSLATSVMLFKAVPAALKIPSPAALQSANLELSQQIRVRERAELEARRLNEQLEMRVAERTASLNDVNDALLREVQERRQREVALAESEERYRLLVEQILGNHKRFAVASHAAGLGFWDIHVESKSLRWDTHMFKLYGVPEDTAIPLFEIWAQRLHIADRDRCLREVTEAMQSGREFDSEFRIVLPSGEVRHIRAVAGMTLNFDGSVHTIYGVDFDITERERTEELRQVMTALVESADDAILVENLDGTVRSWNPAASRLFGYSAEEMIGQPIERIIPPQRWKEDTLILQQIRQGSAVPHFVTERLAKSGDLIPVSVTVSPIRGRSGSVVAASKIIRNITDQQRAEEQMRALNAELERRILTRTAELRERNTLLQEIHHRVKNNLQVISSLINLQGRPLKDQAVRQALQECRSRVDTMAQIHEMLYRAKDYARVPFGKYARELATRVLSASGIAPALIILSFEMEELFLTVDKAIPCGLILNELISNALKHAFPNGAGGRICIGLHQTEDRVVEMSVRDDGIGLPEGFTFENPTSLGVQLVVTLVEQLEGRLALQTDKGTAWLVTFAGDVD